MQLSNSVIVESSTEHTESAANEWLVNCVLLKLAKRVQG